MTRYRRPRPERQHWRWCVLNALDLVQVWGLAPITREAWIARYRPYSRASAACKSWERMKEGLVDIGIHYTVPRIGARYAGAIELAPAAPALVERLGRVLDAWLAQQPPMERWSRAAEASWDDEELALYQAARRERQALYQASLRKAAWRERQKAEKAKRPKSGRRRAS